MSVAETEFLEDGEENAVLVAEREALAERDALTDAVAESEAHAELSMFSNCP